MLTAETDIIIVPGLGGSGPDHWQTRWGSKLSTARRVEQENWHEPHPEAWPSRLTEAVEASRRPALLVAHGLGALVVAHAAPGLPEGVVRGALLVAPPDVEREDAAPALRSFGPIPRAPLPFPSLLVASRNDPFSTYEWSEDLSFAWGSALVDAGDAGHLDPGSGFGPWPEGLLRLATFLKRL